MPLLFGSRILVPAAATGSTAHALMPTLLPVEAINGQNQVIISPLTSPTFFRLVHP